MFGGLIVVLAIGCVGYVIGSWLLKRDYASRCPQTRSVYRWQPPTFLELQAQPPSVFKTYSDMFWNQSPWIGFVGSQSTNKGPINPMMLGGLPTTADQSGATRESNAFLNSKA